MEKIILASASPRRKELLEKAGVRFTVIPAKGEEKITRTQPDKVVEELSAQKALWVAEKLEEENRKENRKENAECAEGVLVIGSDTIVAYDGKILGKPADEEDAAKTLGMLQGNTHQVYTGVTVLERKDGEWISHTFSDCTDVTFYPVTKEEIRSYIKTGEPMDKAGSYGIQGGFGIYVKRICGDYNNVVGLPVARLLYEMKKLGIDMRK